MADSSPTRVFTPSHITTMATKQAADRNAMSHHLVHTTLEVLMTVPACTQDANHSRIMHAFLCTSNLELLLGLCPGGMHVIKLPLCCPFSCLLCLQSFSNVYRQVTALCY